MMKFFGFLCLFVATCVYGDVDISCYDVSAKVIITDIINTWYGNYVSVLRSSLLGSTYSEFADLMLDTETTADEYRQEFKQYLSDKIYSDIEFVVNPTTTYNGYDNFFDINHGYFGACCPNGNVLLLPMSTSIMITPISLDYDVHEEITAKIVSTTWFFTSREGTTQVQIYHRASRFEWYQIKDQQNKCRYELYYGEFSTSTLGYVDIAATTTTSS